MTRAEFEEVVKEALEAMPEEIARHLENVVVVVEDRLSREQQEEFHLRPRALYGLYEGVPLTERSIWESGVLPDRITIFKEALERDYKSRPALLREIRRTVVHEVAHRFGIDEDRLDELGLG